MIKLENFSREIAKKWWGQYRKHLTSLDTPAAKFVLAAADTTQERQEREVHEGLLFFYLLDPIRGSIREVSMLWKEAQNLFNRDGEVLARADSLIKSGIHEVEEDQLDTLFGDLIKDPEWSLDYPEEPSEADKRLMSFVEQTLKGRLPKEELVEFSKKLADYVDLEGESE